MTGQPGNDKYQAVDPHGRHLPTVGGAEAHGDTDILEKKASPGEVREW